MNQPTNSSSSTEVKPTERLFTLATFMEFYHGFNWNDVQDCRDPITKEFSIDRHLTESEFMYFKAVYLMIGQEFFELFYSQYSNGHDLEFYDSILRFLTSKGNYSDDLIKTIVKKNPDTAFSQMILNFMNRDSKKQIDLPGILSVRRTVEKAVSHFHKSHVRLGMHLNELSIQLNIIDQAIENDKENSANLANLELRKVFILDMINVLFGFYKFFEVNVHGLNMLTAFYKQNEMFTLSFNQVVSRYPDLAGALNEGDVEKAEKEKALSENEEFVAHAKVIYFWRRLRLSYEKTPDELRAFFAESEIALLKNAAAAHLKAALQLKDAKFLDLKIRLMADARSLNVEAASLDKVQQNHKVAHQEMINRDATNRTKIDFDSHQKVIEGMTDSEWIMGSKAYHYALRCTFIMNKVVTSKMSSSEKDKYQKELDEALSYFAGEIKEFKESKVILFSQQSYTKTYLEHAAAVLNAVATFYYSRFVIEYKKDSSKKKEVFEKLSRIFSSMREMVTIFTEQKIRIGVSVNLKFLDPDQYIRREVPQVNKLLCLQRAVRVSYPNATTHIVSASTMDDHFNHMIHFFQTQEMMIEAQEFDKIIERDYLEAESKRRAEKAEQLIAQEEAEKQKRSSELDGFVSKIQEGRQKRVLKRPEKNKKEMDESSNMASSSSTSDVTDEPQQTKSDSLLHIYWGAGEALMKPNFEEHAWEAYDELYRQSSMQENKLMQAMALNGKAEVLFRAASIFLVKFNSKDFTHKINECKKFTQEAINKLNEINVLSLSKEDAAMFAEFSNSMEMNIFEIEQTVSFMKLKFQQWEEMERQEYENFKNSPKYRQGNKSDPSPRAKMRKKIEECSEDLQLIDSTEFSRQNRVLCSLNTQILPYSETLGVDFKAIRNQQIEAWGSSTATSAFTGITTNPYALTQDIEYSAQLLLNAIKSGEVESSSSRKI